MVTGLTDLILSVGVVRMGWRSWFVSSGQAESGLCDALVLESRLCYGMEKSKSSIEVLAMRRDVKTERMVTG
jgi:hypothetical protein